MVSRPKRPKTGGRKAGTPNKTTADVKAALEMAFQNVGGQEALDRWAKKNPDEFYKLWVKLLPKEIHAEVKSTGQVHIVQLPDNGRDAIEGATADGPARISQAD